MKEQAERYPLFFFVVAMLCMTGIVFLFWQLSVAKTQVASVYESRYVPVESEEMLPASNVVEGEVATEVQDIPVLDADTALPDITKVAEEVHQAIVTGESTEDFFDTE